MRCNRCQAENREGSRFCENCGVRLAASCASCGVLVAHCHLGLGALYRQTGKRQHAQEHLTTARTMYREMEMPFWLEKAEAEWKVLG